MGVSLRFFVWLLVCRLRINLHEYGLMIAHPQGNGDILVFRPMEPGALRRGVALEDT